MDENSRRILEAALSLPDEQRAAIAGALLETLPPDDDGPDADDAELAEELQRRLDEARNDPSCTVSWSVLRARG